MIVSDLDVCPNLFLVTLGVIIVVSRLVEFLEAHNYRVNVKLRSLIKEYYNGESSGLTGKQHDLGGEA